MEYSDGQEVCLGDVVILSDHEGVVVCCIGAGKFTEEYPGSDWEYLKKGALVLFDTFGLIYYENIEADIFFKARKSESH